MNLFTAHIITPSQVLLFCAYLLGLFLLLNFVFLFSTFLIQCVAWEIIFECFDGVLQDYALSNNLHSWISLVFNIFWTALGILGLSTSGSAYSLSLSALVVFCHLPPLLPFYYLFAMVWGAVCAPFLPKWSWCTPPPWPWCIKPPTLILLLMTWHVLLCGLCWRLPHFFVEWWNRLIGKMTPCPAACFWFA